MIEATAIRLTLDTSELLHDLERLAADELELPTVSAVKVGVNGKFEEVALWLE